MDHCTTQTDDTISRQRAIKAINTWDKFGVDERGRLVRWHEGLVLYVRLRDVLTAIVNLPSVQPEITLESAIDYLRNIGWMQEHDRIMSASAQPERTSPCADCQEFDCYGCDERENRYE